VHGGIYWGFCWVTYWGVIGGLVGFSLRDFSYWAFTGVFVVEETENGGGSRFCK